MPIPPDDPDFVVMPSELAATRRDLLEIAERLMDANDPQVDQGSYDAYWAASYLHFFVHSETQFLRADRDHKSTWLSPLAQDVPAPNFRTYA
jgi:hypothetical protein